MLYLLTCTDQRYTLLYSTIPHMYVQRLLYILKSSPHHSEYISLLPLFPLLCVSTVVLRLRHLLVHADCMPSFSSSTTLLPGHLVFTSHTLSLFAKLGIVGAEEAGSWTFGKCSRK